MEPEDIKTQEELWHWLVARPEASARLDAACIGLRAALRVLPIWGAQLGTAESEKSGFSALHALRALQAANVAQVFPSEIPADLSIAISKAAGEAADKAYAIDLRISHAVNAASGAAEASAHLKPQDKEDDGAFANGAYCAEAARNALRTDAEREVVWNATLNDAREFLNGSQPFDLPLWLNTAPDWFVSMDQLTRRRFGNAPETWSFWRRWWDGVLSGNQLDWDLQRKVALIPEAIWQQGPEAVAAAIRQIERHLADLAEPDLIEKALAALPASPREQIAHFKDTVALHHEDIPPTLDALLEYCGREIDRLQGRNAPYSSEEEEVEAQRQIRVLTSIFSTLRKLQETIPSDGAMNDKDAERGERLTRLFVRLIKQWPRKNAEDLVDSVYRAALVGLTATLGPMIGVSAAVATGAGVALFGGKKISDGIKAAKDLGEMASKP